jgi:hypothetical protein
VSSFGESLESSGRLSVSAFVKYLASVAVKMFWHINYFMKSFYKLCTFNLQRQCCNKLYYCLT